MRWRAPAQVAQMGPCPHARPCVGWRVCVRQNVPLEKILPHPMQTLRRNRCQTRTRPREKACVYGVRVSGATIFSYVENNPLGMIDPSGLRGGGTIVIPTPMYRQPQLPYMPTRSPGAQPVYTPGTGSSSGGYTWRLEQTGNLADGVGALTGGGITGHHPSVPNAIETLIDPNRIEPFVPMGPIQGPGCRTICVPNRPNQCSANSGCTVHCGQFLESR